MKTFVAPQASKFAAIKRSLTNDGDREEKYTINVFATKADAAAFLVSKLNVWDADEPSDLDGVAAALCDFFVRSANDEGFFFWEWKRKGNFRTFRIVEFKDDDAEGFVFDAQIPKLYKWKNNAFQLMKH